MGDIVEHKKNTHKQKKDKFSTVSSQSLYVKAKNREIILVEEV